jgi:predicted RNase H-like HicB family nuclease
MSDYPYHVLVEWDPSAHLYVTYVPSLDYLSTFGETQDQAIANTRDAIVGYLEAAARVGIDVPKGSPEAKLIDIAVPMPMAGV